MTARFTEIRKNFLHVLILGGIFLIPLAWSRYLNANYVSAKFFLVFLVSSFSLFSSSKIFVWPKLPKILFYSLLSLIAMHLASPLISGQLVHALYLFKFFSFAFFAFYFYGFQIDFEHLLKRFDFIFLLTALGIFGFACNDFYEWRIEKLDTASGFLLGTFGNVNMLAEFLVLTFPLVHLWSRTKTRMYQPLKDVLFWGWLFFIFYCRSRSAWIGLGLWTVWSFSQKKLSWKELGMLGFAFASFHASFYFPHIVDTAAGVKTDSFGQRLHLYLSTLKLIADHPIGIGVGQFFNEIVPYMVNSDFRPFEFIYFDQPHSEFLKWAAQFGWLGILLSLLVLGYFGFYALKKKNFFLVSSFVVLLPQLAFQFPFENPASLMYLAFLFARAIKMFPQEGGISSGGWKRAVASLVALMGMTHACLFVVSIFLETSHGNNVAYVKSACELYPINLNGCFVRDQFLIGTGRLSEGKEALKDDFEKFPFHAGLMRILPAFLKNTNDNRKICESILIYDYVYEKQTFFNADILKACSVYKVPVVHFNPEQFKNDYFRWLRDVLL